MNVGSVPYHAFPSVGYAISASHSASLVPGGKASIPVSPSSYIYSQFKHVSGTPAPDGVSGVNINKLKIIDTLIEQLSKMKKQPEPLVDINGQDGEKRINALINQYHNQVRSAQAANANNPYAQAAMLTGAIFNVSV